MHSAPHVAVYLVTYRRPELLRRAIQSVLNQTHADFSLYVVNDAPDDEEPSKIVTDFWDARVRLFEPIVKRGATANFNLVFHDTNSDFCSLLEDDNWWEPEFLACQIKCLGQFPDAPLVISNETIWKEEANGAWTCTDRTIWPFRDVREHNFRITDLCGRALLCNSSMLVRTKRDTSLVTPDNIPVDVTEHFRERLLPASIPLNGRPLVNYAETLATARDNGPIWRQYQIALIGSVFVSLKTRIARRQLARELWKEVASPLAPRAGCLVDVGFAVPEARDLLNYAPTLSLIKAAAGLLRSPNRFRYAMRARHNLDIQFGFLKDAPLTRTMTSRFDSELSHR